ncbi:MAG: DUF2511 domain-containing protein [Solirubrobacteraceae bacterium]
MKPTQAMPVVALSLLLAASGCGETSNGTSSEKSSAPNSARLEESKVPTGEWPLTVASGEVRCEGGDGAGAVIFQAPDGTDYAVNGAAKTAKQDLPGIDAIWKKDPDIPGARVNISPVLDRGLELCD